MRSKTLKIVQVCSRFDPFVGGIEKFSYELSKRLAEQGHEVHIITSLLDRNWPLKEEKDGFHIHRCPCLIDFFHVNPLTFIIKKLMKIKPDIIHAHSYIFLTSNQAALTSKLNRIPFILHLHGGLDVSLSLSDFSTQLKLSIKKTIYDHTIGKWTVRAADIVASVSREDLAFARKKWDIDKDRLSWIPNAIDLNEFHHNNCADLNVLFIGRLESWKGLTVFLKMAKIIGEKREDVNFIIIGKGNISKYVTIEASHLRNVKFLGFVPRSTIINLLSDATVLVLPSYGIEGLPTVCLEALAAEVPVVASNVGGTSEIVLDGETGYLFPPGNVHLCAEKVLKLLANDTLRRRMGKHGRNLVEQFYTWDKVVKKTERIYETIKV